MAAVGIQIMVVIYLVSMIGVGFGVQRYYSAVDEARELRRAAASWAALREARDEHRAAAARERTGRQAAQKARQAAEAEGDRRAAEANANAASNRQLRAQLARANVQAQLAARGAADAAKALDTIELCPAACYAIKPKD